MTLISYDRETLRLRVEGHAGAAPRGRDTVCAALSMLVITLSERANMKPESYMPSLYTEDALVELGCNPDEENERSCREMFETVAAGLSLLAENFPEYVTMNISGEEENEEEKIEREDRLREHP